MTGRHLLKRSFTLAGHRTSVALEAPFWAALERLAAARAITLSALVQGVDAGRADPNLPLASALRVHALQESPPAPEEDVPGSGQTLAGLGPAPLG